MLVLARLLPTVSTLSRSDPVVVELVVAGRRTEPRPPPRTACCLSGVMPRPLDRVAGGVADRGPRTPDTEETGGGGWTAGTTSTGAGAGTEPGEKCQYMEDQESSILTWHPDILLVGKSSPGTASGSANTWLVLVISHD